jgi:hypothetical protein
MNRKRCGLSPTSIMIQGLHAPRPPWDLRGINPLNNQKAHAAIQSPMSFLLLMRSRQPDHSSGDLIPRRMLPSSAASASDQIKFKTLSYIWKIYL